MGVSTEARARARDLISRFNQGLDLSDRSFASDTRLTWGLSKKEDRALREPAVRTGRWAALTPKDVASVMSDHPVGGLALALGHWNFEVRAQALIHAQGANDIASTVSVGHRCVDHVPPIAEAAQAIAHELLDEFRRRHTGGGLESRAHVLTNAIMGRARAVRLCPDVLVKAWELRDQASWYSPRPPTRAQQRRTAELRAAVASIDSTDPRVQNAQALWLARSN